LAARLVFYFHFYYIYHSILIIAKFKTGGAVASLFAHDYPDLVSNLALVCPAMKTPVLSEVHNKLMDGDYTSLIPQNGKQLANTLKLISVRFKVKYLPSKIMDSYINLSYTPQKRQLLSKSNYI
jgi:hypothetical protein